MWCFLCLGGKVCCSRLGLQFCVLVRLGDKMLYVLRLGGKLLCAPYACVVKIVCFYV